VPLVNQQKQEASHNLASVTPSLKLHTSPKVTSFGSETLSSEDLLQRQVSDGFPVRGHGVGGQWNQQVRQQLQPQHQQRPVIQGSVYAPSNSGPG